MFFDAFDDSSISSLASTLVTSTFSLLPCSPLPKTGAITKPIKQVNFIKIFIEGPEVSLNGSPTVSPVTDALCASEPLYVISPLIITPASNDFLALSQAPPALFWKIAHKTPDTVTPAI